ncbi:MAG: AMP-binding protein, partial [Acidobacteriota bacterium]
YWRKQLGANLPVLDLPIDHTRQPVQTFHGAAEALILPYNISQELIALCLSEVVTLFMLLLAAFKVLLYRYSGQQQIVIGSPIANRNHAEIEGLIGFFVNTLVLCTDLSGDPSFQELLGRVREVALGAYAHQDLPFEKLVEELQPQRDISRTPLFQVMFVLQNAPMETWSLTGLTLSEIETESKIARFDLIISMVETTDGLKGWFQYNTDLFDATTISRMATHFQNLLASVVAAPQQCISTLPLFSETEQQQLLVAWNNTKFEYLQDISIQELFEQQTKLTPDAIAVEFAQEQLTYQELNLKANQLAHFLEKLAVGREVLVGICMPRSIDMIIGILGILKAGGAYVPLDPSYPKDRLAFMLDDIRAEILITQSHLIGELSEHRAKIVSLDTDWQEIAKESVSNPKNKTVAGNLAYIIYTSGSTGRPKGVAISHKNLVNSTLARISFYQQPVTKYLLLPSFAFDSSIAVIYGTLCQGGTLLLLKEEICQQPDQVLKLLVKHQVSHLLTVPSFYNYLLTEFQRQQPSSLRVVIVAGESCSRDLVTSHFSVVPTVE